jgi:peptidoglycan/xylan/chitin deacetylase (PgdA/CDA1 family)
MQIFKTPRFFRILFPNKTWGFSRSKNAVYLTFDDGPDSNATNWVLDYLKSQEIKATFFCVGANVQKNQDLFERLKIDGHVVGNHTMEHNRGTKTSDEHYFKSVESAANLIDTKLFRPPYGRIKLSQTYRLKKDYSIIMWSWLSYDFDSKVPVSKILKSAEKEIKAGDILVFHDNPKSMERLMELLPRVIEIVRKKGLYFEVIPNPTIT